MLLCRPGFESECAAEMMDYAVNAGIPAYIRARTGTGFAHLVSADDRDLDYLLSGATGGGRQAGWEYVREVDLPGAGDADLMETAYLFVPPACEDGANACGLHLVLHGCAQSAEVVGTDFIEQSGYLPWAEANGIVLAFPQVEKSLMAPMNPHGCWDWWGYTGLDYLGKDAPQISALWGMVEQLAKTPAAEASPHQE